MKVSAALIGAQDHQFRKLSDSLSRFGESVSVNRRLSHYPSFTELEHMLRAVDPEVLFVSTDDPSQMEATVQQTMAVLPGVQVILLDAEARRDTLRIAMQLGVRECVQDPYPSDELRGALERSLSLRASQSSSATNRSALYSFLPAKAGVGATTLAVQGALNLPLDRGQRGLLIDSDLEAGIVKFLLQLRNHHSFTEALEFVEQLDEHLWPQLVNDLGNLDILHAGELASGESRIDLNRLQHVLNYARRQYSIIFVDLPSALNRLSIELMNQSKLIFLVTTPEISSMHLARTRLRQLADLQLSSQVRLIVNRVEKKGAIGPDQVAKTVGIPVYASFANDYAEVQKAFLEGKQLSPASAFGKQLKPFAESLAKDPITAAPPKKRRFLEVFALQR